MADWQDHIPERLGDLPLGGDLLRTDPGGPADAPVVVLGVYPALTRMGRYATPDGPINVPVDVERTSFAEGSSSGREIDSAYLSPLGLTRQDVLFLDMYPYFLANTASSGKGGRSMWDNVQTYQRVSGHKTAVEPRPSPDELLERCRSMAGNLDRLATQLDAHPRRLLLTLGNEAAAFVRGDASAKAAQPHLLAEPVEVTFAGRRRRVIHLPHPGIVMRRKEWRKRLNSWVEDRGRDLMAKTT
jgi:hypothetical protein